MKKIYDCFTFFNELDILEIRFEELYDFVDYFVLVESDHTFMNNPKPYYFEENKERYARFLDKVIHIKSKSNCYDNPWSNESFQRNSILEGVCDAASDDIIIISDVDEIIRSSVLANILQSDSDLFLFEMPAFYYKFNFLETTQLYPWSMASSLSTVRELGPESLRSLRLRYTERDQSFFERYPNHMLIKDAGWHLTYIGDNEFIKHKFNNYSHAPEQNTEYVKTFDVYSEIHAQGHNRVLVCVDEYFPQTILNNKEMYSKYIEEGEYPSICEVFGNKDKKRASACIIAVNAEKCIARAIQSLREIEVVDDIVVVDSGSTDSTVAICEGLGCRVFYRAIDGDFAAQRNFASAQCKHDWIIVADADEWYPKATGEAISALLQGDMGNTAVVRLPEITVIEPIVSDTYTAPEVINEIFGSNTQEELFAGCASYQPNDTRMYFTYTYRILNRARGEWVDKIHEVFQPRPEYTRLVLPRDQYLIHQKSWAQQYRSESGYFIQNNGISACLYQSEYDDFDGTVSKKSVVLLDDIFRRIVTEVMSCDTFIEAGAFNGETSRQFKTLMPNVSVYAFEANPYNYNEFLPLFADTQVNYIHCALSDKNEDVTFRVHTTINGIDIPVVKGNDSLLLRNNPNVTYENFTVKGMTLDNYFSDRVNLNDSVAMWVDLEGVAFQALEGAVKLLDNVDVMKIEVESYQHWQDQKLDEDIRRFLSRYGFFPVIRDYEYPNQYNIIFCKKPIILSPKFDKIIQSYENVHRIAGIF